METPTLSPGQVAWSVQNWRRSLDLSASYTYELINAGRIKTVKVGGKRLITTPPGEFIERLAGEAA